jgi:hypothetical protein
MGEYGRAAIWVATTVQRRIRVVVWYIRAEIRDTRYNTTIATHMAIDD